MLKLPVTMRPCLRRTCLMRPWLERMTVRQDIEADPIEPMIPPA